MKIRVNENNWCFVGDLEDGAVFEYRNIPYIRLGRFADGLDVKIDLEYIPIVNLSTGEVSALTRMTKVKSLPNAELVI